jgi:hypothetical protein
MNFLQNNIGLIALVIIWIVSWIIVKATGIKASKTITDGNSQSYVLYYPRKLVLFSVLIMLVGIGFIAYMNATSGDAGRTFMLVTDGIIGAVFLITFIHVMLKVEHFRVTVNIEKGITVYPTIGSPYSFTTSDIVSVKRKLNSIATSTECFVVRTNTGKKFRVVSTMVSYNEFQRLLFESCGNIIK